MKKTGLRASFKRSVLRILEPKQQCKAPELTTINELEITASFEYRPLKSPDSIRLLHLQPSTDPSSPVVISLSESRLQDTPAHEALSYTWGDPQDRRDVIVLSHENDTKVSKISITANCHSALSRLRLPTTERLIWVDAICINQDDTAERNSQVTHMGKIYSRASKVIIDVGEQSGRSDIAIDFITDFYRQTHTDDPAHNSNYQDRIYVMTDGLEIRDIVAEFYKRPWFSRVWVLQEVYLAQAAQLLCGDQLADWSTFRPFRIWVDSRPAWERESWHVRMPSLVPLVLAMNGTTEVGEKKRQYSGAKDLLELLCETRNCQATDPRDKIFALLSMVDFPCEDGVSGRGPDGGFVIKAPAADYNKTTADVYTETAAWLIQRVGLSLLSCAGGSSRQGDDTAAGISGLPSWVPDWSTRFRPQWMINNPTNPVYHPLRACGDVQTVPVIEISPIHHPISTLALKLRGLRIDTIHLLSHDIPIRFDFPQSEYPSTRTFLSSIRSHRTQLPPSQRASLPATRHWTPRTGETRLHPPNWATYEYGLPLPNSSSISDNDVCDYMTYLCGARQLMVTQERGYVGVVPGAASEGDVVVVFEGGVVPFVLRKVGEKGSETEGINREYWKLIGEAYVYGLMHGEAFKDDTEEDAESEVGRKTAGSRDFVII